MRSFSGPDVQSTLRASITALAGTHAGLLVLLAVYVVGYAALIVAGHGVPYVMDNNETFSSLNHARNLWTFDFFRSFGLADEAVSPNPLSHPVVHSHQGNFPRLFAFLLYGLGARTAESQIWITTFTVGVASVAMGHAFFKRLAGQLFATVAMLVLITDYLMFAQWQVNTYRVWHGFFLFAALLCVHGLGEWKRWIWVVATIALYAGLFYWELVFVAFVSITAGLYTGWVYRRRMEQVLLGWTVQGVGAVIGLAAVIVQLIFYLGWDDFLTDLNLTVTARNYAPGTIESGAFLNELKRFYETKNIAFFLNIGSGNDYLSISAFLRGLFQFIVSIPSPFLSTAAIAIAGAAMLGDSRLPDLRRAAANIPPAPVGSLAILTAGVLPFMFALFTGNAVLGQSPPDFYTGAEPAALVVSFVSLLVVSGAAAYAAIHLARALAPFATPPGYRRSILASTYLVALAVLILFQSSFYDAGAEPMLDGPLTPLPAWLARLVVALAVLAGLLTILAGRRAMLGRWHDLPRRIAPFLLCGSGAYLIVYRLSSGYLHSGYLVRLAPLPVFVYDVFLALGLFTGLAICLTFVSRGIWLGGRLAVGTISLVSGLLVVALTLGWTIMQGRYYRVMPPDRFAFVNLLESPDLRGNGIVSNSYAVPFGLAADTWAYIHNVDALIAAVLPDNLVGSTDVPYLWLADRSNPAYRRPELFVCFSPVPGRSNVIAEFLRASSSTGCSLESLARELRTKTQDIVKSTILARDEVSGHWAIVRLYWPPS